MKPYNCDKCKKEIVKGKSLYAVRINGKLMQICADCKKENGKL
jgi:ribosomal protein L24E